jgi:hypothetical protein
VKQVLPGALKSKMRIECVLERLGEGLYRTFVKRAANGRNEPIVLKNSKIRLSEFSAGFH